MSFTLITGPVRSGKSRFAEQLASRGATEVTYVATASRNDGDSEWVARLERHRRARPAHWRLVETAGDKHGGLGKLLRDATAGRTLLVDSLGTWVADRMTSAHAGLLERPLLLETALEADCADLVAAFTETAAEAIVVGEEAGWGIVPAYASARVFRDVLGRLQQSLGARAARVYLAVGGFALDVRALGSPIAQKGGVNESAFSEPAARPSLDPYEVAREIEPVDTAVAAAARAHIDELTKPLGALGRLEELAVRLSAIAGRLPDRPYTTPVILVAAADHGAGAENVSAYPAEVTHQMVSAFTGGYAAINAFARAVGAELYVADFGIRERPMPHPLLLDARVGAGTANLARGPALGDGQVEASLAAGIAVFERLFAGRAYDVLALGEMGIANTTSAAAVVAALTGADARRVVGRGTGIDDAGLERKVATVRTALARFTERDWHAVAREVGGFEIVGMAGIMLAAARRRIPVVLDGFIVSAAALLACALAPATRDYLIAAHVSVEPGHRIALAALDLRPLLDLELRLGEGTGAALALPLIEAATRMSCEMKTFAQAGVATAS